MPSESSSPWHPAFMPNSEADLIVIKSAAAVVIPSNTQTEPSPESPKAEPVSFPSEVDSEQAPEQEIPAPEDLAEGHDEHPDLSNLRDALATSLASPGGVELEDNPVHNGTQQAEDDERQIGDFPSEGPSHENKHLSTMSFARTVSHEFNWGEEDEVDAEWNLHRTDTDPFKSMAKSDRTNSFPAVPATHSLPLEHVQERLPHSQAEDIMNEVEHSKDLFSDDGNDADNGFFTQTLGNGDAGNGYAIADVSVPASRFGHAYGGDFKPDEDEEEAQFQEGIPLVQHAYEDEIQDDVPTSHVNFGDDGDNDHDFFAQVSKEDVTVPAPTLERKSTMQVLDSLDPIPPFRAHEDIIEEENEAMESSQSSLDRSTGGGIGVSTSTVLSQVLGDSAAPIHDQPESLASLEMDSGEGDLAAKWKAALAGDEFLDDDDDELLPDDDEPADIEEPSKELDPSVLFGSDDEGFLDDSDDKIGTFTQQISPPIPAPVTSLNGHVMGSDSLTGALQAARPGSSGNRYVPAGAVTTAARPAHTYAPAAPLLTDFSQTTTASIPSPYMAASVSNFAPPQRPEMPKAQSFADKSKGGYASPYDLPMEVAKPARKRVSMQQMNRQPSPAIAPPRSTSMYAQPPQAPASSNGSMSPPTSSHGLPQNQARPSATPTLAKKSSSGFFEELPMSNKPKPAPRHQGSYQSPAQTPYGHPAPQPPPMAPPLASRTSYAPPPVQQHQPPQQPAQGLVAPERVSPYAALPTAPASGPPHASASRYSPSLSQGPLQPGAPPPVTQSRYSPAPPNARQHTPTYSPAVNVAPPIHAHQPRTSSPLAHFERNQDARSYHPNTEPPVFDRRSSSSGHESSLRHQHLPPTREVDESELSMVNGNRNYGDLQNQHIPQPASHPSRSVAGTPPPPQGLASRLVSSPPKRPTSNYQPQQQQSGATAQTFAPPMRSQTQSPGSVFGAPRRDAPTADPYQRPASVEGPTSPRAPSGYSAPSIASSYGRKRGFSQGYNYIAPTDGREHDPLQRWKGAPVFAWGVGGTVVTSFPKDVPRYGMGQSAPMIIRSPGEVKIKNIKDIEPLEERLAAFPGPLKGKAKKKDVLSWLTSGIAILEQNAAYLRTAVTLSHEDKRGEERILLWKILRVFIENDGTLEGSQVVDRAVRAVLSPGLDSEDSSATPLYATGAELSGISASSAPRADAVDPTAVDELRKHLLRGDREKAVWEAVDKRLWAHAMLISNTVSRDLYKQVTQEFVQKEVKNIGDNTQPLAALYEIFAGNFEESVDELVPPSARAGFQMVSASNITGPSKDATEGLDRWRETLGLVLSNRSPDDNQALNALGKLLSGYGRAEAAHICFLFARSLSIFGGIDDPQASIVLVGSDQLRQPYDFDREMEPILLSEVFEYGMSLASTSAIALSTPHLAVYKLQHAKILAENGFRDKALQYCDTIATSINSQTRRSPYHHALLVSEIDDLSKRLKSSPKDDTSSWISKPSMDKAKGSVWATFNKFVAGDESDTPAAASNPGANNEVGPFARIAGGTPTISRSPSSAEIYGSYNGGLGINGAQIKANSRYAPGGSYSEPAYDPLATSYGSQPRASLEERSSNEFRRYEPQRGMSDYRPNSQAGSTANNNNYSPQTSSTYTPQASYTPNTNNASPYEPSSTFAPQTPVNEQSPPNMYSSPQPINIANSQQSSQEAMQQPYGQAPSSYTPSVSSYQPFPASYDPATSNNYAPSASSGYEPPTGSYEPSSGGYEPPSYEPASMNDEPDSPVSTRPKKSFMDDDDDDIPALKKQPDNHEKSKAEKDREADEAFKKAAEADAQKAKESTPAKKGWGLGGWFGGSKKEADMSANPNKPIRAKLGEASSFVYDPELKRWINKKGGAEASEAKTATPPPPKAGPPRTSSVPPSSRTPLGSGSMGPPPQVGQRAVSASTSSPPQLDGHQEPSYPALAPPAMTRSASNGSIGLGTGGMPSGPPSRPGTGMSNASSIDDLLGPPMPRKGAVAKKAAKKKGRGYIDVMGEK